MAFPERSEYETLIYGLPDQYAEIAASTLHLYSASGRVISRDHLQDYLKRYRFI